MSKPLEDIPFPVLPKPYLIAIKLKAGSKDNLDISDSNLYYPRKRKRKPNN